MREFPVVRWRGLVLTVTVEGTLCARPASGQSVSMMAIAQATHFAQNATATCILTCFTTGLEDRVSTFMAPPLLAGGTLLGRESNVREGFGLCPWLALGGSSESIT